MLEVSLLDDVKNPHLERGTRRALVGLFGRLGSEFAALPQKTRDALMKGTGLGKRTTPIFRAPGPKPFAKSCSRLLAARKTIDDVKVTLLGLVTHLSKDFYFEKCISLNSAHAGQKLRWTFIGWNLLKDNAVCRTAACSNTLSRSWERIEGHVQVAA